MVCPMRMSAGREPGFSECVPACAWRVAYEQDGVEPVWACAPAVLLLSKGSRRAWVALGSTEPYEAPDEEEGDG